MVNNKYFCYFVEGDNEKKIVNELKGKYQKVELLINLIYFKKRFQITYKIFKAKKEYLYHSL